MSEHAFYERFIQFKNKRVESLSSPLIFSNVYLYIFFVINEKENKEDVVVVSQVAHTARAYPSFCSTCSINQLIISD